MRVLVCVCVSVFFFNDTATTEIYTLSLHDALPILLGTGACSSYDVISILRKARQDVVSCEVEVSSERAKTEPKVFTDIHIHFKVTGKDLKEKHVLRTPFSAGNRMPISSAMMEITTNSSISVKPRRRSAVTDIV